MTRQQYAAYRALNRDEIYRDRPEVSLPEFVTFTNDGFRAFPTGYGFCARQEPAWRLDG